MLVPLSAGALQGRSPVAPFHNDAGDAAQPSPQAPSRKPVQATPKDVPALMQQAEDALERKDYQSALEPLKKVTGIAPETPEAWYYLGYAYQGLRRDDEARESYEKAVALKPDLAEAQVNLGLLLLAARDPAGALPHLEKAVELKPNDARAHLNLGLALDDASQPGPAEQEFRRALELDPKSDRAAYELGEIELVQKHYDEAITQFTKALELKPANAEAEKGLATAYEALGKMPEAGQHFEQYLKLQPADATVRLHLARLYLNQHSPDHALAELHEIEQTGTVAPDLEAAMGDAYALAGKFSDSESHYRRALAGNPGQADLHRALAETLLKENKNADAESEFRKALAIDPGNADAIKGLASSLYLQARFAEAAPLVERLLQSPSASPGLYFILATCYDHLRDRPRALEAYKQFLARAKGSNPDQEWQARQRAKLLSRELGKSL